MFIFCIGCYLCSNKVEFIGVEDSNWEKTIKPLTRRERLCLDLLAKGHRIQVIAIMLEIAPVTVEMHLRNARAKLKANTTPQAVAIAIKNGEIAGG